jgi:hypothetical protein
MDILGGVFARAAHNDVLAVLVPFEDRSWTNAEPAADFSGN